MLLGGEKMWNKFNIVYIQWETLADVHIVRCRVSADCTLQGTHFSFSKRNQHTNIYSLSETPNLCFNNDLYGVMDCQWNKIIVVENTEENCSEEKSSACSLSIEIASKAHKETQFSDELACKSNSLIELKLFDRYKHLNYLSVVICI